MNNLGILQEISKVTSFLSVVVFQQLINLTAKGRFFVAEQ